MDETRKTARAIADLTADAYRNDVVTGLAPGITLADLIENAIRERDEKHAEELETQRARVAVLEEALRGLSSDLDRVLAMRSTLGRTEWLTTIAEKARRALEVEP